ncbi:hypothetical protein BKA93DRAFT_720119, partial [Sparassis latifolia]
MKPRDYCCCAIPILYVGIYVTLTEQFVLGILAGTLSVATPSIVGASTPSYAKWIFAVICYVAAAVQLAGFFAVWNERPTMFRRYTTLHLLLTIASFAVAAAWIILSATRHSNAKSKCETDFYGNNPSTISEASTVCNIFPWVDIGLMGGLWVLLAVVQLYLCFVLSSYSSAQERDHLKYDSMYDATPLRSDIPLGNRSDAWESRPLTDEGTNGGFHDRSASVGSVSTVVGYKPQQPAEYGQTGYPP